MKTVRIIHDVFGEAEKRYVKMHNTGNLRGRMAVVGKMARPTKVDAAYPCYSPYRHG